MLLINFWQVLVFLIAFLSLKQAKNEGELGIVHGKARLKLNYMKNPSFRRASKPLPNQSSMQGRESEKESNIQQFFNPLRNIRKLVNCPRRNFASLVKLRVNFATPCKIFASQKEFRKPCETKAEENQFRKPE